MPFLREMSLVCCLFSRWIEFVTDVVYSFWCYHWWDAMVVEWLLEWGYPWGLATPQGISSIKLAHQMGGLIFQVVVLGGWWLVLLMSLFGHTIDRKALFGLHNNWGHIIAWVNMLLQCIIVRDETLFWLCLSLFAVSLVFLFLNDNWAVKWCQGEPIFYNTLFYNKLNPKDHKNWQYISTIMIKIKCVWP